MTTKGERWPAEQQGDGQPENEVELSDPASGAALSGEKPADRKARSDEPPPPEPEPRSPSGS